MKKLIRFECRRHEGNFECRSYKERRKKFFSDCSCPWHYPDVEKSGSVEKVAERRLSLWCFSISQVIEVLTKRFEARLPQRSSFHFLDTALTRVFKAFIYHEVSYSVSLSIYFVQRISDFACPSLMRVQLCAQV